MKCWHCNTELIWGGDHDIEEENDTYSMVTNLSCPECRCFVEVYYPNENTQKEYEDYERKEKNERKTKKNTDGKIPSRN